MRRNLPIAIGALTFLLLTGQSCIRLSSGGSAPGSAFYRSNNRGQSWSSKVSLGEIRQKKKVQKLAITGTTVTNLKFSRATPNLMVLSTPSRGLYLSTNQGDLWKALGYKAIVSDFELDGFDPLTMYVTGGSTIRKSIDGGETWKVIFTVTKSGETIRAIGVDFYNPQRVIAASNIGVIYLSSDAGATWTVETTIKDSPNALFFNPNDSRIIFLRAPKQLLWRSDDGGKTWNSLKQSFSKFPGSSRGQNYAFSGPGNRTLYLSSGYGILRSTDNGTTWQPLTTILPPKTAVQGVAVDPADDRIISFVSKNRLHRTIDGGTTWQVNSTNISRSVTFFRQDPTDPTVLYIGTKLPPKKK